MSGFKPFLVSKYTILVVFDKKRKNYGDFWPLFVCYEMGARYCMTTVRLNDSDLIGKLYGWFRPLSGIHQEGNPPPPRFLSVTSPYCRLIYGFVT